MQCRQCGYALWNLTEPRCPECGTAFDLRNYRFRPGTVAFACPHCHATHAGTGDQYVPSLHDEATCSGCGQAMAVPRMPVVPLTDDAWATELQAIPWDDRRRLGFWRAWWATFKMVLTRPTEVVDRLHPDSGYGQSYLFAFTCHLLGAFVQTLTCGGAMLILTGVMMGGGWSNGQGPILLLIALPIGIILFIGAAISPLLATLFIAAPAHAALWLLEPKRQQNFLVTARAVNYALAPATFMAIPLLGLYCNQAFYIWTLVLAILMLARAHHTHGGKATLAVLWLPALMFLGYVGIFLGAELIPLWTS